MRLKKITFCACLILACEAQAFSQSTTNEVRSVTLQDCIRMALERNLDIRIERFKPQIDQFLLGGLYGYYEPALNFDARESFNSSPASSNPATFNPPPNESYNEIFTAAVVGQAPSGLSYDITSNLRRHSGLVFRSNVVDTGFEYSGTTAINLRQPLLRNFWIDTTRFNIQAQKKALKITESGFSLLVMRTVTSVENAYYDLIFSREKVKVQEKALQLAEKLLSENRKRVEVGALAPLDEKQAESELSKSRADLLTAMQTLAAQENLLKNLVTDDFASWRGVAIVPAEKMVAVREHFDIQDSWDQGLTKRPELQQLRYDLERRDIRLKFYKNQLFPALDLVGSYGHNGLDRTFGGITEDTRRGQNPFYTYGVSVTIPLGNRSARYNYKIGKAEKAEALLQYKKQEQTILVEIEDAIAFANNSFERVGATRDATAYAELALVAEQKKLESGKSTSFQVLQLQRDLTSRRSEEIQALTDYNKALSDIALKEGNTLERNNLKLDIK